MNDEDRTITHRAGSSASSASSSSSRKSQILNPHSAFGLNLINDFNQHAYDNDDDEDDGNAASASNHANRTLTTPCTSKSSNNHNRTNNAHSTSFNVDDDLENFINENFQPATSTSNTKVPGPNTSLDENDFKPTKSTFKRASLQSLDGISSLTASSSTKSLSKKTAAVDLMTKKPVAFKKRTSETTKTSQRPVITKTAPVVSKQVEVKLPKSFPVVNMTKTAQLRASKQQQLKNTAASKLVNSTSVAATRPSVKSTASSNTSVLVKTQNETNGVVSSTLTRRISFGSSQTSSVKKPQSAVKSNCVGKSLLTSGNVSKNSVVAKSGGQIVKSTNSNSSKA